MSHQTGPPAPAPHRAPQLPAARAATRTVLRLTTLTATATAPKPPTPLMGLTYAVQMIVGTMVGVAGARFFAAREAARCD
ncbi:hypothetical protein ACFTZK_24970 [Streptomyces decoyicus]|uniref:hypothetical protein n=1 Tax=Streptomyces decoyicus TaxID=249567 RepID=UPI00363812FF